MLGKNDWSKQRIVCGAVRLFAFRIICTKAEVQAAFVHPPRVSCFEFFVVERLASMYLTALSLSDTSNRLPTEIKRHSEKEKHRKHRANTPKLHSRDALCRAEKPRSCHERTCFLAFSRAAITLSHHSSNSGSSFWNSGCARIF